MLATTTRLPLAVKDPAQLCAELEDVGLFVPTRLPHRIGDIVEIALLLPDGLCGEVVARVVGTRRVASPQNPAGIYVRPIADDIPALRMAASLAEKKEAQKRQKQWEQQQQHACC